MAHRAGAHRVGTNDDSGLARRREKYKLYSIIATVAVTILVIVIVAVGKSGGGGGVSTDYTNGYQNGYTMGTQWAGDGDNPCNAQLSIAFADGTLVDNDADDDGSTDYDSGWSAGCDDAANNRASQYP
jgi:hypothetical protein